MNVTKHSDISIIFVIPELGHEAFLIKATLQQKTPQGMAVTKTKY